MRETDGAGPGALDKGTGQEEEGRPGCPPLLPGQRLRRTLPECLECPAQRPALPAVPLTPHLGVAQGRGFYILIDTPQLPHNPAPAPCHCLGASYHILLQDNCNIDIQRTRALADCGLTRSQTGLGFLSRGHGQLLVEKLGPSISEQERARNPAPF